MGAWIETGTIKGTGKVTKSRPAWARGLKLILAACGKQAVVVAPRMGAWIETRA